MNRQKKRGILIVGIIILLVLVTIPLVSLQSSNRKLNALLNLGEKYLEDLQYESAIAVFDEAIAIEPKCAKAYLGKAKAQYALKRYQDAIDTLREGIERVDDPVELETFLQQILDELSANNKTETEQEIDNSRFVEEEIYAPIILNYKQITRRIDTNDPVIQLEVLGSSDEEYIWESSNPECVTVSDTGLITCQPVAGYAYITATTEERKERGINNGSFCEVIISSEEQSESVRVAIGDGIESQKQYLIVELSETEGEQMAEIIRDVYYSGDILIPEQLTYQNKTIPITNISSRAFYWSYEMESVFIPAFIEGFGGSGYYSQNPFGFCLNLEEIKVDEKNENFQVIDGVLYSKDGKKLICYPSAKIDKTYTIPQEVETIYSDAFRGCINLEEILVAEENAYYESVDGVLMDKQREKLIAYPAGNRNVRYTVPESVTTIPDGIFYGSNLEEIVCKSVEWIYASQFLGCNKLKKIECGQATKSINMRLYESNNGVEIVGLDKMENLEQLSISLSETQDISEFAALQGLKSLSLNVNKRAIDLQALRELTNLTSIEIVEMDNIKDFSWLANLENLQQLKLSAEEYWNGKTEFKEFEKLKNIEYLNIWGIHVLSDLSWITNLEKLRNVDLYMEKSEIEDLTPLLELENLNRVLMHCSQQNAIDQNMKMQIEQIKEERPDVYFDLFE